MSYATVDDLAQALRVTVTLKNADLLQDCVDQSTREIDHDRDPTTIAPPLTDPADLVLAKGVCIGRGIEWYKSNDSVFGMVGFAEVGILAAPRDTFARWSATLIPLRQQFGVA